MLHLVIRDWLCQQHLTVPTGGATDFPHVIGKESETDRNVCAYCQRRWRVLWCLNENWEFMTSGLTIITKQLKTLCIVFLLCLCIFLMYILFIIHNQFGQYFGKKDFPCWSGHNYAVFPSLSAQIECYYILNILKLNYILN